jgi:UDP-2,3-diacylglucosamine hydrolase
MNASPEKKIYFLSDFHLGSPNYESSLDREKKVVAFLESVCQRALAIFIVGDMFDFWYEYKHVVPKGYVRIFGKLAELTDSGIPVYFFVGNHDMWMSGYFEKELNIPVYFEPRTYTFNNKKFLVGHGDGLGPGDHGYKFLKSVFRNKICQWLFGLLPPAFSIGLANYFSNKSRQNTNIEEKGFMGENKEWLVIYSREVLAKEQVDFFIFGHRHLPLDYKLSDRSRYINLGDWISNFTYAEFDGNDVQLKKWES